MTSQYLQGPSDCVGNRLGVEGNSEPRKKVAVMVQGEMMVEDEAYWLRDPETVGLQRSRGRQGLAPWEEGGVGQALAEPPLPQVVSYLAGCGLQSCPMLLAKVPRHRLEPLWWQRYLDFLRFAVFVNGEARAVAVTGEEAGGHHWSNLPWVWSIFQATGLAWAGVPLVGIGQGPEVNGAWSSPSVLRLRSCPGRNPGQWLKAS